MNCQSIGSVYYLLKKVFWTLSEGRTINKGECWNRKNVYFYCLFGDITQPAMGSISDANVYHKYFSSEEGFSQMADVEERNWRIQHKWTGISVEKSRSILCAKENKNNLSWLVSLFYWLLFWNHKDGNRYGKNEWVNLETFYILLQKQVYNTKPHNDWLKLVTHSLHNISDSFTKF